MKKITIKNDMYGGGVHIIVCPEKEIIEFFNKKYKDSLELDGSKGIFYRNEKADLIGDKKIHNYIWLKEFNINNKDNINTLFHEVQHFIVGELNRREIKLIYTEGQPNDESFAYYAGQIYQKVYNIIPELSSFPTRG